jgi:hypothetical protein
MSKKIDDGFIPELGVTEYQRDLLSKRDWSKPQRTQDPNHPDNWSTAKCIEEKFSGFRVYHLTQEVELWVLGYIKARVKIDIIAKDPGVLATMHENVFQTGGTLIELDHPIENPSKKIITKTEKK